MLTLGQTAQEWLKFNYNLEIGSKFTFKGKTEKVKNIKETDNIGHYKTDYPVVIGIHDEHSVFPEKIDWITIESIFK